jgi:perosamine synthetase
MIPINRPDIDITDIVAFIKGHFKGYIPNTECTFSEYIGTEHAVFTNSCRNALYLTYRALKLEGEVIVSPLTCSIAIKPIIWSNLKPHFVDIDAYTYNIDTERIKESITNRTCAIQVIHLAGNSCDMKPIMEIAEDYNLLLIEDCAQSLGAEYQNKKVGSFGDFSCFSFTKNLYAIGGGMVVTNDREIASKIRKVQQNFPMPRISLKYYRLTRNIIEKGRGFFFGDILYDILLYIRNKMILNKMEGYNFFESNLSGPSGVEASTALLQIGKLDNLLRNRIKNALLLDKELKKIKGFKNQTITKESKHAFAKYMIETKNNAINIIKKLHEKGIDAKHLEYKQGIAFQERFDIDPYYNRFKSIKNCKNYLKIHDHVVSLPISSNMTEKEISIIANEVGAIIENA